MNLTRTAILFMAACWTVKSQPFSASPSSGSAYSQTFTFAFNVPGGTASASPLNVLINSAIDGRQACYLALVPSTNTLLLVENSGGTGFAGSTNSSSATIQNSQCSLSGFHVSAPGNSLVELTLTISFFNSFAGRKIMYFGTVADGWHAMGIWTVPGDTSTAATVTGASPSRSTAASAAYAFTFAHTDGLYNSNGTSKFTVLDVLINSGIDGRNACYLAYIPSTSNVITGTLVLVNDAGNSGGQWAGAMNIPGNGSIQNSQCSISGTSVSSNGNSLTLSFTATFQPAFAGDFVAWAAAISGTSNSTWQPVATLSLAGSSGHLYTGWVDSAGCATIQGWAADLENPYASQIVTVYVDGWVLATAPAKDYRSDLGSAGIGTGNYGFTIPSPVTADGLSHTVEVRLAGAALNSSIPFSFSCTGSKRIVKYEATGDCGDVELTISTAPQFNGTVYSLDQTSGFYVTTPGDSLSTSIQVVRTNWPTSAAFNGQVGYYSSIYGSPLADHAAPNNGLSSITAYTGFLTLTFNPFGLDAGSQNGSASQGNYYFGGQGTLQTCRASYTQAPIMFRAHVSAAPTITSISPSSFPANVGAALTIMGTNFGLSGTVEFSGPGSIPPVAYTTNSSTQINVNVNAPSAGTYNVAVREGRDSSGFAFQLAGAQGQPPTSQPKTVTVTSPPYPVILMSDGTQVANQGIALIKALPDPRMPQMTAQLSAGSNPPPSGNVQWQMTLAYSASQINYSLSYQGSSPFSQAWDLTSAMNNTPTGSTGIVGGNASINWTFGSSSGTFSFRIRGENPDRDSIVAFMTSLGEPWFGYRMARHESGMKQFCPIPVDGSTGCVTTSNEGLPLLGIPRGYGLLQYDPPASPSDTDLLWNWKVNISRHLSDKIDANLGWTFWSQQIDQWNLYNSQHPNAQVSPPADQQEGPYCVFTFSSSSIPASSLTSPGPYWFGDAGAMKRVAGTTLPTWSGAYFNPGPTSDYIFWDGRAGWGIWRIVPENIINANIVRDFCNSLP